MEYKYDANYLALKHRYKVICGSSYKSTREKSNKNNC